LDNSIAHLVVPCQPDEVSDKDNGGRHLEVIDSRGVLIGRFATRADAAQAIGGRGREC